MKNKNKELLVWAIKFMKPFFPFLLLLLLFYIIGNYASTFEPCLTGKIIDSLTQKNRSMFFDFLKIIIVFQVISLLFSLLSTWIQFSLQRKITIFTQSRMYLNILYLPSNGTVQKQPGKILNSLLSDRSTVTGIFISQVPSLIVSIFMLCTIGLRLFKIDIILFVLTLSVSFVPMLLAKYFGKRQAKIKEKQSTQNDEYMTYVNETIAGLSDISNYSMQQFFLKKIKTTLNNLFVYVKSSTILRRH